MITITINKKSNFKFATLTEALEFRHKLIIGDVFVIKNEMGKVLAKGKIEDLKEWYK
jgi:hypothetical protein